MTKFRLAIFASGAGSNAVNCIQYFKDHSAIEVVVIVSNKSDAKVLTSAAELGVPTISSRIHKWQMGAF